MVLSPRREQDKNKEERFKFEILEVSVQKATRGDAFFLMRTGHLLGISFWKIYSKIDSKETPREWEGH